MKTYKITYLMYNGKESEMITSSVMSSNFVRDQFIEDFTESTFIKIELI